jgi:hypothetical protein
MYKIVISVIALFSLSALLFGMIVNQTPFQNRLNVKCISGNCINGFGTATHLHKGIGFGKYVGQWANGKPNGSGVEYWANGNIYVGNFVDGQWNGIGTWLSDNGEAYAGQWKDGALDGYGLTLQYNNCSGLPKIHQQGYFKSGDFISR